MIEKFTLKQYKKQPLNQGTTYFSHLKLFSVIFHNFLALENCTTEFHHFPDFSNLTNPETKRFRIQNNMSQGTIIYLPWNCKTDWFTISFSNKLEALRNFIGSDITTTFWHVADTSLRYIGAVIGQPMAVWMFLGQFIVPDDAVSLLTKQIWQIMCDYWLLLSGRAGQEKLWPKAIMYGLSIERSVHNDQEPNIFTPLAQEVSQ